MAATKGNLSINSENMLPIIKKWLYSDHDIFVREQISNASDAITKLRKLEGVGEYKPKDDPDYKILVEVNPDDKTLTFIDNGIGMTADEVVEYITQIAFSGATKFLEKYQGKTDKDQIIGHFGLGFYSAFMVADEVHIDTLSYLDGAKSVHWESDGVSEYTLEEGDKDEVGTEITLFLNDDSLEFCNEYRMREVLEKYCAFMPYPIYLSDESEGGRKRRADEEKRIQEDNLKAYKEAQDKGEEAPEPKPMPEPRPINDVHPLWAKMPNECTDDEYKDFYRKVFRDYKEPLFWIHLNTEYPFNLHGILYFPKLNNEYEASEAEIKLYNNQVFIADNIKEVIPEFLMALKGVVDCPDLPLNVSRSALQNDGFVKKISDYICRKMADKLTGMCKTQREKYEECWEDIGPFIKYGFMREEKFAERMADAMLFRDLDGKYLTMPELKEALAPKSAEEAAESGSTEEAADANAEPAEAEEAAGTEDDVTDVTPDEKEPEKLTIYYVTDEVHQAPYVTMFKNRGKNAVILRHAIDNPYITALEHRDQTISFARIDSGIDEALKGEGTVSDEDRSSLTETFRRHLDKPNLEIEVENMADPDIASVMTLSEESRRMVEMFKMYGMDTPGDLSAYGVKETLTLNAQHPLVKFVLEHRRAQAVPVIVKQLYDLAALAHKPLTPDEMGAFVKRSQEIMMLLTK